MNFPQSRAKPGCHKIQRCLGFDIRPRGGEKLRYLILGGDERNFYLYKLLKDEGADVQMTGFDHERENLTEVSAAVAAAEIIMAPIPFSKGQIVNTPFHQAEIPMKEIFSAAHPNQIMIGGRFSHDALQFAKEAGVQAFDILEQEEMAVLNAIPTAEGAVQIAMENTKITIHDSHILVMGFGRIGKILSKILLGIGAKVSVSARKGDDLAFIRAFGCRAVSYEKLPDILGQMDIIINTVPNVILDKSKLGLLRPDVLVIELASKPFGIDAVESRKAGVNVLFAPSLPGKAAPLTAARYIRQTMENILREAREAG